MRRLPGPAGCRLCEGAQAPEALHDLFRDWQRTPTQSSVRTLRSLRQQMDVRFCQVQEPPAERHCCVAADSDQSQCALSTARHQPSCFFLTVDLHRCRQLRPKQDLAEIGLCQSGRSTSRKFASLHSCADEDRGMLQRRFQGTNHSPEPNRL